MQGVYSCGGVIQLIIKMSRNESQSQNLLFARTKEGRLRSGSVVELALRPATRLRAKEAAELVDLAPMSIPKRSLSGETNMQRYFY